MRSQQVLDEAKDLIKMVHDCIKEREEYEERYEQKPQNLCKWCSFHKSQGGPCDAEVPKWEPTFKKHIVASILRYTIELQRRALKEARSPGRGRALVQTSIHASN